jgi:hypothetical protein
MDIMFLLRNKPLSIFKISISTRSTANPNFYLKFPQLANSVS